MAHSDAPDPAGFAYTFDHPDAPSKHKVQYFEMLGSRGIYKDGWWAGSFNHLPWPTSGGMSLAAGFNHVTYDTILEDPYGGGSKAHDITVIRADDRFPGHDSPRADLCKSLLS